MNDRHNHAGVFALVGLLLLGIALPNAAAAQDLDPYHAFILDYLANEYNIDVESGEFVIGTNESTKLDQNPYGSGSTKTREGPDPDIGFEYVHTETIAQTNAWDSGITWPSTLPIDAGDTGLALALVRGESSSGGPAVINIFVERAGDPYDKFVEQGGLEIDFDWRLIIMPFTWPEPFGPGGIQFGVHLSAQEQFVDITAPVILNFGTRYTPAVLEGLIASGGQIPLVATFSQDVTRGVPPFTVNFDASLSSSPGEITSYSWDFGDGGTATGQTASHEYTAEGIYEVILTIQDNQGGTMKDTSQVIAFDGVGLPESPLEIPYTEVAPTIDGQIDGAWSSAVSVDIEYHVNSNPPSSAEDLSGSARAMWDGENLYVLYEITDEVQNNDTAESWQDDSVDLYVDGRNEKGTTYDDNDVQFEFSWYPADSLGFQRITGNAVTNGRAEGVEYSFSTTSDGYIIEAKMPWTNTSTLPVTGTEIGIEFMVNDADLAGPVRDTKLAWYGLVDLAYQNPSLFGTAVLTGGEGMVIAPVFTITPSTGMAGVPITFDASESVAPGAINSYEWDFGDGNTGSGAVVDHTYDAAGSYQVSLTISDDQGNNATRTRTVNVSEGALEIPRTDIVPVIDGTMEEVWNTYAVSVTLDINNNGSAPDSPEDLSARAYAMWDLTHIYVFFDITDDVLVTGDSPGALYQDDQVEFFLDADNSKSFETHDANDAQFAMNYGLETLSGDASGKYPNTVFATVETENGWALEAAVPWGDVSVTPYNGMLIGIDFQVNDDDDLGDRDHKISWFETTDNGWQWAHVFGTGVLLDPYGVNVEEAGQLPERFAIESVYPNPFNPKATAIVSVRDVGAYEVQVYNVLGQLVQEQLFEAQTPGRVEIGIDLATRASGLYLISVKHKATGKTVTSRATLLK